MLQFFNSITDSFLSLLRFIGNIVSSVVIFFGFIPRVFTFMTTATSFLPTFLVAFFTLSISLLVVKVILDLL